MPRGARSFDGVVRIEGNRTEGGPVRARVAVMGLGPMGAPIARNLAQAGARPVVWNRSAGPVERLRGEDIVIADSPAAIGATTILSVLPDVDQLREASGPEVWAA